MPQRPVRTSKQRLIAALKLAVSIGLLAWLLRSMDTAALTGLLARLPPWSIVTAVILLIVQTAVLALRWWLVMIAIEAPIRFRSILPLTYMGVFFNQVLPTSFGGDAVRIWQARRLGIDLDDAIAGVLLERIGGVFGLVVVTTVGTWYLGATIDDPTLRLGLIATLPLAMAGLVLLSSLDRLPETWRRLPLLKELARLARNARRTFLAPGTALPLLLLSVLSHLLAAGTIYGFARGLDLELPLSTCVTLFSAVILVTMIPISFAGWGLREGAMVTLFAFAGVGADTALALSLAFGVVFLVASLPGCVLWFLPGLAGKGPRAGSA